MGLVYAAGWVIAPGALLGIWFALRPPDVRAREQSFAVVASLLTALLVASAGGPAGHRRPAAPHGANEIKERYVFYAVPLLGICFALYAKRGWPAPRSPPRPRGPRVPLVRVPLSGSRDRRHHRTHPPILFAGLLADPQELGGPGNAPAVPSPPPSA